VRDSSEGSERFVRFDEARKENAFRARMVLIGPVGDATNRGRGIEGERVVRADAVHYAKRPSARRG
jgi:hypothetical protein